MKLILIIALSLSILAKNNGQYAEVNPIVKNWIKNLKDRSGNGCCDLADGYPAEAQWDTKENSYRVFIEGKWYLVPEIALLDGPNLLNYAVVWYVKTVEGIHIRCFIPGPQG